MKRKSWLVVSIVIALAITFFCFKNSTKLVNSVGEFKKPIAIERNKLGHTKNAEKSRPNMIDDNVLEFSQTQGVPNAKLVKREPNGTRIYQVGDTQITVAPDGELFFLPKNI